MWSILFAAIGLMLVLEAVLPLLFPTQWRNILRRVTELRDGQIRFLGLASLAAGLIFLFVSQLF